VPSEQVRSTHYGIFPLSFLQIYQASGTFIDALKEQDASVQEWFGNSLALKRIMTRSGVPLYYHWFTSGYGAFADHQYEVGWVFLRGWRQVLYVEGIAVLPEWRQKGVGTALMNFAEQQARELHREWLGLTVTISNNPAVSLYQKQGYQQGHAKVLVYEGAELPSLLGADISLRPVIAQTAGQLYRSFAERDLQASDPDTSLVETRFLGREPYRRIAGQHWLIRAKGSTIGYIHKHGSTSHPVIYLTGLQPSWGSSEMLAAIARVLGNKHQPPVTIEVRLGSAAHHDVMCAALTQYGFVERPATTMKMFKHLA